MNYYKTIILMSILLLGVKNSYAQFNKVRVGKIPPMMEVFQVDNRESSTMVYIKYTRREGIDWSNINEKTFARARMRPSSALVLMSTFIRPYIAALNAAAFFSGP